MPISGTLPSSSGAFRGHLSGRGRKNPEAATRRRKKVPGKADVLGGAAYRNRTDDLRITRGLFPGRTRPTCTHSTDYCIDSTRGPGIMQPLGPRTGPRPAPSFPSLLLLKVAAVR